MSLKYSIKLKLTPVPKLIRRVRGEFDFLKGNMLVLIVSFMLSGFSSGLTYANQSLYYEALGANLVQIGLISSIISTISAFIRIPGAYLADRLGRRKVIVPFTFLVAIGLGVQAVVPDWRYLIIAAVFLGIAQIYQPALEAIEMDSVPEEKRGLGFSIINMAPGIFSSISPIIAGLVVTRYGLDPGMRYLYGGAAFTILLIAILRYFKLEETLEPVRVTGGIGNYVSDAVGSFREAFGLVKGKLRAFFIMEALYSFTGPAFWVYLSLFVVNDLGLTYAEWGVINSLFLPVSLILSIPVGKYVDSVSRRASVLLGTLLFLPVGFLLVISRGFIQVALVYVLMQVSQLVSFSSVHALKTDLVPEEHRGRVNGLNGVIKHLVAIPAAPIMGWLSGSISTGAPFVLTSIVYAVVALLVYLSFGD